MSFARTAIHTVVHEVTYITQQSRAVGLLLLYKKPYVIITIILRSHLGMRTYTHKHEKQYHHYVNPKC